MEEVRDKSGVGPCQENGENCNQRQMNRRINSVDFWALKLAQELADKPKTLTQVRQDPAVGGTTLGDSQGATEAAYWRSKSSGPIQSKGEPRLMRVDSE